MLTTIVIIEKNKIEQFHQHVNNVEESIQFTIEKETKNFLDLCVKRNESGTLNTNFFFESLLNYNSAQSTSQNAA